MAPLRVTITEKSRYLSAERLLMQAAADVSKEHSSTDSALRANDREAKATVVGFAGMALTCR
jgi:hypothetical protein